MSDDDVDPALLISLPVNPRYRELYQGQTDRDRRRALAAQMSPRYLAAMLDIELGLST